MAERSPASLGRLLRPQHIAVIGGRYAEEVVRQCHKIGYPGAIWPVNPAREEIQGLPCYADVTALPQAPDAAFVGVAREASVTTVAALASAGCGGAIVLASGFAEHDRRGAQLQRELVDAAGDMPLVGPNCYGLLNYLDGAALWPDQHGGERCQRGVALITQSGNIGVNLTMQQRSLPLAYLVSVGNQAVLSVSDYLDAFVEDERVSAIGLHLEGVREVHRFADACAGALRAGKPVVVLKSGRSAKGAAAALSHTSALTGADELYDALFQRYGVARAPSQSAFIETLKLLHVHGALPGHRLASMSCSGGEAGLVADLAQDLGLELPAFGAAQAAALRRVLGERVTLDNPLDYHTYIWADRAAMTDCYAAVLSADVDTALLVCDYPVPERCDSRDWATCESAFIDAHRRAGNRPIAVSSLSENFPRDARERYLAAGIAPMQGLDDCLLAVAAAARIGAAGQRPPPAPLAPCIAAGGAAQLLDEHAAKALLRDAGLRVPDGRRVGAQQAAEAASALGFPVVVKSLAPGLAHKSEAGAVRLNLADREAVAAAVEAMRHLGDEFLVERMIDGVVAEMLLGVVHDEQFGPVLVIGAGGEQVELLSDCVSLLLPASAEQIARAVARLRSYPLLCGYRGRPAADEAALIDAALRLSSFAQAGAGTLLELDINPLLVLARGAGAIAADALIRAVKQA